MRQGTILRGCRARNLSASRTTARRSRYRRRFKRDRRFESAFLQRGVYCEPDLLDQADALVVGVHPAIVAIAATAIRPASIMAPSTPSGLAINAVDVSSRSDKQMAECSGGSVIARPASGFSDPRTVGFAERKAAAAIADADRVNEPGGDEPITLASLSSSERDAPPTGIFEKCGRWLQA